MSHHDFFLDIIFLVSLDFVLIIHFEFEVNACYFGQENLNPS